MADANEAGVRFRRPWYWLIVVAVVAVAGGVLCVMNAQQRIAQGERAFRTAQQLRLAIARQSIDNLFEDAAQLTGSGSAVYATIPADRALLSRVTRELFASALDRRIYGAGAFFAPDPIDGKLVSFYVRRTDPGLPLTAGHTAFSSGVEIDYASAHLTGVRNYAKQAWFTRAIAAGGQTIIWGPYRGAYRTFISMVRAFYGGGRLRGVFLVDVIEPDFVTIMRRSLVTGDVAAIVGRSGHVLVSTGPVPVDRVRFLAASATMPFAPNSRIELLSDASALRRDERAIWMGAAELLAGFLVVAALISIGTVQRWRAQGRQQLLENEQRRLERQIEIARTVEEELRRVAYTDALTGLPNRRAFLEYAATVIGTNGTHAVLFIDLDRFNVVNETMGHLAGDEFLRVIGTRLTAFLSDEDMIARLGGDEFVLIGTLAGRPSFHDMCERVFAEMGQPIVLSGRSFYPEASIGIVTIDTSYANAGEVLRDADIAMYEAKRRGRGRYVIFDAEMRQRVAGEAELEVALRRALERKELMPYYQPVVRVETGEIAGFEALVRWGRNGTIVNAGDFMPFAEQHGLAAPIDVHMLQEIYRHSRAIYDVFPQSKIAINISAPELASSSLVEFVEQLQRRSDFRPGESIVFEITETAMMTSSESALHGAERLREIGIELVLDDFGTGYSSLAYLQRLPISGIKIDRSFVEPLARDAKAAEIVRSIVLLARSFGLTTTAEGVETREQWDAVRCLGVDFAQGFFFSPAVEMASLLRLATQSNSGRFAVE